MKKISITIATPHRRDFSPEYVISLARTLQDGCFDYQFLTMEGCELYRMRNMLAERATTDFVLFADTDVCWTSQDIKKLVEADKDIAGGLYFSKLGERPPEVFFSDPDSPFDLDLGSYRPADIAPPHREAPPTEPFQCDAIGAGFMLIKRRVFEAFQERGIQPFNLAPIENSPGNFYQEDISFCRKAKRVFGFEIWCIPAALVIHIGTTFVAPLPACEAWTKWRQGK